MATSKPAVGPHQFADEGTINVRTPMPFVCSCSYLVLIPAYLYRPLYHLLHRVRIERCMFGSHLSWVTLLHLPSTIALFQHTPAMKKQLQRVPSSIGALAHLVPARDHHHNLSNSSEGTFTYLKTSDLVVVLSEHPPTYDL
jgi:hypothetical protein